jgi:hypothetical protein
MTELIFIEPIDEKEDAPFLEKRDQRIAETLGR